MPYDLGDMANSCKPDLAKSPLDAPVKADLTRGMTIHLRAWRKLTGLTLEQTANKLSLHLTTLQKWEKGSRAVDTGDLQRLADLYGVHPAALFFHPNDRGAAARLTRAYDVLARMDADKAESWLVMGEKFAPDAEK